MNMAEPQQDVGQPRVKSQKTQKNNSMNQTQRVPVSSLLSPHNSNSGFKHHHNHHFSQSKHHSPDKTNYDLKVPRFLKVTNRIEDNDLDLVKSKLRKNMVCHMNFDPSYENSEGRRYFARVYVPNQPETVFTFDDLENLDPASYPQQNLYDYIIDRGFNNFMGKGTSITSLRTGYDPAKLRARFELMRREFRLLECKQLLKQLQGSALYSSFLEKFKQEGSENPTHHHQGSKDNEKRAEERKQLEKSMQMTLRKFLPNNFTGSFTVMRQKIEKLVDDGYTFTKFEDAQKNMLEKAQE